MITFLAVVAVIIVVFLVAVGLAIRARSVAYGSLTREQVRISRRMERREKKLRLRERKQQRIRAKKRLMRIKIARQARNGRPPVK